MKDLDMQEQVAQAQAKIRELEEEIAQTQQGLLALTMELEQRVDERTAELRAAHAELEKTNSDLMQLTIELEDRVNARIADLVIANKALRASEERSRATLYSIGDAVISTDTRGRVRQMNPVAERLTGWTEAEAQGKPIAEVFRIVNEDTRAEVENPVVRVLREGVVVGLANHTLLIARGGAEFPIADAGAPIRTEQGEVSGVVLVFRDQTAERKAEKALRESERKFRETVVHLDEGYYSATMEGLLLEHNLAFNRILGFPPDEDLKGKKLPDFWQNPEDRRKYLDELMATGSIRNYLINAMTMGGEKIVIMANSHLVKDEQGRSVRIEGTFADFTERRRAEERIAHLNLVLQAIRNVNQLIVREKEAETLIQRACDILTQTRGYFTAWIALYDDFGKFVTAASAGMGNTFEPLMDRLRAGRLATCASALQEAGVHVVQNPATECADCPAAALYENQSAIAVRLEHRGQVRGLLVISMDAGLAGVTEERHLIEEMADDIAYALHGLETGRRRSAAEASLRESERKFRETVVHLDEGYYSATMEGLLLEHNLAFNRILGFPLDQDLKGSKLPDFWQNPEQRKEYLDQLMSSGVVSGYLIPAKTIGGEKIVVMASAHLAKDEQGRPMRIEGTFTDFTERRRAEEALQDSEKRFRLLFDNSVSGIMVFEAQYGEHGKPVDFVIRDANPSVEKQMGLGVDKLMGRPFSELVPDLREAQLFGHLSRVAETGEPLSYEIYNKWLDRHSAGNIFRIEGNRFAAVFDDITDRKRAEAERDWSAQQRQLALTAARLGWWHYDPATQMATWDDRYKEIFEVTGYERPNEEILARLHPDDLLGVRAKVEEALDPVDPKPYATEYRINLPGGSMRWVEAYGVAEFKGEGDARRATSFVGTVQDITERKRAEEELRRHRDELEVLVKERSEQLYFSEQRLAQESAAVTEIVTEMLNGQLSDEETERQVLKACLDATGSVYGMIGRVNEHGKYDATSYGSRTLNDCAFPEALAWDMTTGMDIRGIWGWPMLHGEPLVCNDLEHHPARVGLPEGHVPLGSFLGVPVKNEGRVTGMIAVANRPGGYTEADVGTLARLVDVMTVSKRHRELLAETQAAGADLEQRVADRTAQLEESNKELEAFSYSVSHDLRAPLRAIDGFTRILVEDYEAQFDAEGKRVCSIIRSNTVRMGRLIDDLLAFSRLGRAEMRPARIDMESMAHSVFQELTTPESRPRIDFHAGSLPPAVGDAALMRQVWTNLLSNALKFSSKRERGVIEVRGEQQDGETVYSVRDNGAGFDMQYVDKLFGVFQRLHGTKEFEGTGVGLALVARVVRRHGGRVWAEGEVNRGAAFYFVLPEKGE